MPMHVASKASGAKSRYRSAQEWNEVLGTSRDRTREMALKTVVMVYLNTPGTDFSRGILVWFGFAVIL